MKITQKELKIQQRDLSRYITRYLARPAKGMWMTKGLAHTDRITLQ